ncbi:MAG: Wzz/FepE/Etk N-terminal domain-containing protein [Alteraurantiacibacter sp.]
MANLVEVNEFEHNMPAERRLPWSPRPEAVAHHTLSLRDFVRLLERHKRMILLVIALITLPVFAYQLMMPNLYSSSAHVQVQLIDEVGTNQADVSNRNEVRVSNAVRLNRSRSSAEAVILDLDLLSDPEFREEMGQVTGSDTAQMHQAINTLLNMLTVSSEPNSDLIQVTITTKTPELSARIANQYPDSVSTVRKSQSTERREELLTSLLAERADREEAARTASNELAEFRRDARMPFGLGTSENLSHLNQLAAEAASASANSAGSSSRSSVIAGAAGLRSTAQATSAAVQQLERQQATLLAEKARAGSTLGANHPDMVRVTNELSSVEAALARQRADAQSAAQSVANAEAAQMREMARSQAAQDAARAGRLQGALASVRSQAFQNNENSVELSELERNDALANMAFASIVERIEQVRAQMQLEGVNTTVVSPAVANYDRVAPAPAKMTVVAMLGSAVLAVMMALGLDLADGRLRTSAHVARHFGLPTLGMLPRIEAGLSEKVGESPVLQDPHSLFAEAARSTYSEMRALRTDGGPQSVLITSPLPNDGKSTVSLTLAAAAKVMGQSVVLVDLDLRMKGLLKEVQKNLDTPDIVDVLTGRASIDDLLLDPDVKPMLDTPEGLGDEEIENAFVQDNGRIVVLSAKQPVENPAALLNAQSLRHLLANLKNHFDLLIINAPAALAVRDARAMCDFTDHTLVVSRWGRTTIEQMSATLETLSGRADGVVFDHVDYAEHARRQYGDSIQFYVDASDYYSDDYSHSPTIKERVMRMFGKKRSAQNRYAS